jgi:hypothetical protein
MGLLKALRALPVAVRLGARRGRAWVQGACLARIPLRAIEPLAIFACTWESFQRSATLERY